MSGISKLPLTARLAARAHTSRGKSSRRRAEYSAAITGRRPRSRGKKTSRRVATTDTSRAAAAAANKQLLNAVRDKFTSVREAFRRQDKDKR